MRNNLAKTAIITKPDEFCKIAYDDRLLWTAEMVSEEAVHVSYTHKKDFVEENSSSNIFVSLFTTSAARLQLYKYMRQVADHPRSELLYTVSPTPVEQKVQAQFRTRTASSSSIP